MIGVLTMKWFIRIVAGIAAFVLLLCSPMIINDISGLFYRLEITADLARIAETDIVQVISGVGHTCGNGDHTELWLGVIVHSDLSREELQTSLRDMGYPVSDSYCIDTVVVNDFTQLYTSEATINLNKQFDLSTVADTDSLYIIEFNKTAPCFLDIRGA